MATILVVDDYLSNRQFLVSLLGYGGHRLLEASNGKEALEVVRAKHPDMVITDILMPTMDGYEFVHQLRTDPAIADTTVIFHSAAYLEREVRPLAQACGVSHILPKPADPEVILSMVNAALGITQPPMPLQHSEEFDREHLRVLTNKLSQKADELEVSNLRLAALIELGLELSLERDPVRLLKHCCQAARGMLEANYAAIGVLDDDGQTIRHFFISHLVAESASPIDAPSIRQTLLDRLLTERQPYRLDIRPDDPQALGLPPQPPLLHSFLGAPIVSSTGVHGFVYFADKLGVRGFSNEDERLAASIAAQVAVTYENAKWQEDLQQEVAERKRAEEEVRILNAELEQRVKDRTAELRRSNAALEEFAYLAAHDLQEPLRKDVGYSQLLAKRYQGRLDSDADEMHELIQHLLAYLRVGGKGTEFTLTNCEAVLNSSLANVQGSMEEKSAVVTHDPLPTVMGDAGQLVQLFQNLISNAIKFNSVERPHVHIQTEHKGEEWLFSVRDNGIGIDPQFAERIFVIFQRLHSKAAFPGTGIGLAICKKIVERHNGRIWVESQPGQGSVFYFTIPALQAVCLKGDSDVQ